LRPAALLMLFALVWSTAPVRAVTAAPVTSPITSRDYAVDLYTASTDPAPSDSDLLPPAEEQRLMSDGDIDYDEDA
jgi:hypothetical protein